MESQRGERKGGKRRVASACDEARTMRQQQLERKAAKQERREVERRARVAWQRMPADAPHHVRMAAAHQAARAFQPVAAAAVVAQVLDGHPEPEPEPEPEQPELVRSEDHIAEAATAQVQDQLRVTVISEASSAGGGKGSKGRRGGAKTVTLTMLVRRSEGVVALLAACKNKLRAKKKGGKLLVAATRDELSDSTLLFLVDGTELRFVHPPRKG